MRIDPLCRLRTPVVARHVGRSSVEHPRQTRRPPGAGTPDDSRSRPAAHLLLERDAALHGALESSEFFEDLDRALKDRPLDAGDFGMDLTGGRAWASGAHPALDCLGSIELPAGSNDCDDLDGAVALGERLPQAPVRVRPGAERRLGIVAESA